MTVENQEKLVGRVTVVEQLVKEYNMDRRHVWPGAELQAVYAKAADSFQSGDLNEDEFRLVIRRVDDFYTGFNGSPMVSEEVTESIISRRVSRR